MNKSYICKTLCYLVLCMFSTALFAKDLHVSIKLQTLQAIKPTEAGGDELYFSIIEYPTRSQPIMSRVPMFPLHWVARDLSKLSDVTIWSGFLKQDESRLLVISLIEQDLSVLNPDDHLGSVQVQLSNKKGKLSKKWGQPNYKDQPAVLQTDRGVPKFMLYGDGGQYQVEFKVEVK